jgi:subtilisin family serine protease
MLPMKIMHDVLITHRKNAVLVSVYNNALSSNDGTYIIRFDSSYRGITESVKQMRLVLPGLKIHHTYRQLNAIAVLSVSFEDYFTIQSLSHVTHIEPDYFVEAMRVQNLQNDTKSWGIDRIDGKLDNKYHYAYTGKGVRMYIIDSGIQVNHDEFIASSEKNVTKQRARCGKNLRKDLGENCYDEWGHGTHVAAIIGKLKELLSNNLLFIQNL